MVELTDIRQKIRTSLITAISDNKRQTVYTILNSDEYDEDDIQAALSHEGTPTGEKDTILDFAIICLSTKEAPKEIKNSVRIIKQIWEAADQKTRDSVCCHAIGSFQDCTKEFNLDNIPHLKEVIQEVKGHKGVMDRGTALRQAIDNLNAEEVKTALEGCGEDIEEVLMREVYWSDSTDIDYLLIYPLKVKYDEDVEKIKEITKLLWDKASPNVRDFWLEDNMVDKEDQNTGDNYIIASLENQQKMCAGMAGEGWLEDFIQEVKDYRQQRDIKLNDPILEEEDEQAFELAKKESLLTAPIATNTTEPTTGNQTPGNNDAILLGNEKEDTVDAATTSANGGTTSPTLTADNNPPEKNDTTFWSEHKGKIVLGVTGLCVAGAVAAYVLAYPVVALVLAALATAILMGAGVAKVLEDPSVKQVKEQEQRV